MSTNLKLGKELFWDIPEKDIQRVLSDSKEWVVERVFEYGTVNEIFEIIDYYGKATVSGILVKAKLKTVARAMAHLFLDLELK